MILKQNFHNLKNKKMASTIPIIFFNREVTNSLVLVAAGRVTLVGWLLQNHSTAAYLKLYNAASISDVTLASTVPDKILAIPTGPGGLFFLSNEDKFQQNFNLGLVIAVVSTLTESASAPAQACSVELSYDNISQ